MGQGAGTAEVTEGGLLGGKIRYRQLRTGHRSGFEPVLLAAAVPARPGEFVLEAGTGAGAALLCLGYRVAGICGQGLEIADDLASLANENFKINGLQGISCVNADLEGWRPVGSFDHALANPPWHDKAGSVSPDPRRALAHHAGPNLLAAWVAKLAHCLRPGGTMTLILPAASFGAALRYLAEAQFTAVSLFPLWPRAGLPARQIILQARRQGPARILPGLVLHDQAGITPAAEAVLRDGAGLVL